MIDIVGNRFVKLVKIIVKLVKTIGEMVKLVFARSSNIELGRILALTKVWKVVRYKSINFSMVLIAMQLSYQV